MGCKCPYTRRNWLQRNLRRSILRRKPSNVVGSRYRYDSRNEVSRYSQWRSQGERGARPLNLGSQENSWLRR